MLDLLRCKVAGVALAALALAAVAEAQGPPPARVVVDAARIEQLEERRPVTGTLRADRRALLAAEEAGLVVEIRFEEGAAVEAGAVIARLDDALAGLELERAQAERRVRAAAIAQRDAERDRAVRQLRRLESLFERQAASQSDLDDAVTAVKEAEARLEQARAEAEAAAVQVRRAERRLADMTVRAPFPARVVAKRTEVGQWLRPGDPVAEVIDLRHVEARLDVPEALVGRLDDGAIEVRIPALGYAVRAQITEVIPEADPLSRLFPVRVRLPNPDGRLMPGMRVTGLVPTGAKEPVLTVHKDALLLDEAGEYVYFDAGGVAAAARVAVLFAGAERVAVRAERLAEGAAVVVEGNERLFPGQPLAIVPGAARAGEAR